MPIPTNRTTSNTPAEHVSDHNLLHAFYNAYEGFPPSTFASASHTHAANAITSGVIDPARLGTGTPDATDWLRGDGAWTGMTMPALIDHDSTNAPIDGWVLTLVQGLNKWLPAPSTTPTPLPVGTRTFTASSGTSTTETVWQAAATSSGGSGRLTGPRTPVPTMQDNTLNLETSGLAVSVQFLSGGDSVAWIHNDANDTYGANPATTQPAPAPGGYTLKAGSRARFFGIALATGARLKTYNMRNVANTAYHADIDFSDVSRCTTGGISRLYIFDTNIATQGGNPGTWSFLYRCVEPDPAAGADPQDISTTRLRINWANVNAGAGRYCAGMFVDPSDGFLYLFQTRNVIADPAGAPRAEVYKSDVRVDTAADDATITMTTIGTFPVGRVDASTTASEWCSAADIAPDRSCFLIHTYANVGGQYDRILLYDLTGGLTIVNALAQTPRQAMNDGTGRDPWSEPLGEGTAFLPGTKSGQSYVGYVRAGEKVSGGAAIGIFTVQPTTSGSPSYTLTKADENYVLWVAASAGVNGVVNVPSANDPTAPRLVWIKRRDSQTAQTMVLHPAQTFTGTIDGSSADISLVDLDTVLLWNVLGSGWFILGAKGTPGGGGAALTVKTWNAGTSTWVAAPAPSIFLQNPSDPDPEVSGAAVTGDIVWRQYPT